NQTLRTALLSVSLIFVGCGSTTPTSDTKEPTSDTKEPTSVTGNALSPADEILNSDNTLVDSNGDVTVSGKITFDRVPIGSSGGLDYNHITQEPAREIVVALIDSSKNSIATTTTDKNGQYSFTGISQNTSVKVRAYAMSKKTANSGSWDVAIVDNTNDDAQYVIEGSLASVGTQNSIRNLNAPSGWSSDFNRYVAPRASAPFAILDSVYSAMQYILQTDSQINFPKLTVNWSNIIIHEWGHYFEKKFSRADSIGGSHLEGDRLDIRVAFSEGWCNAFSSMVKDDPIYVDTGDNRQASNMLVMDMESGTKRNPGYFSESSVQRILYDLYDDADDGYDELSLGFEPIYDILTGTQKITPAFTSLFPFIKALKDKNSGYLDLINRVVLSENISSITSIYGDSSNGLYGDMSVGTAYNVCTSAEYGKYNKLYNHKYIRLNIASGGTYNIDVRQYNGTSADPDFALYHTDEPFSMVGEANEGISSVESKNFTLASGNYLLDMTDYNGVSTPCFSVNVN
ncbi:MAG: hypothetical protein IE889_09300, partial [Campylobacterales bacterium]|nr:hypothetical protein [Campylobacterales bacterium]